MKRKSTRIAHRIIGPLVLTAFLQTASILGLLTMGNDFQQIGENALAMLDERTQNKHQSLQMEMKTDWSYLAETEGKALLLIQNLFQKKQKTYRDIEADAALNAEICTAIAPEMIARIRSNNVSGAFLILWGNGNAEKPDCFAGIYLRDLQPGEDLPDNSDLSLLRGPAEIAKAQGIPLSETWQESFNFPGGAQNDRNAFFFLPLLASVGKTNATPKSLGYWAPPFLMNKEDNQLVITYSEPLTDEKGNTYGVLGVEINVDTITSFLCSGEFARSGRGCYYFGITRDEGKSYEKITTGGPKYFQYFRENDQMLQPITASVNGRISVKSTVNGQTMRGSLFPLNLYPEGSRYSGTRWALIGMSDESTLFAFRTRTLSLVLAAAALTFILGAIVSVQTGKRAVKPIIRLADSLKNSEPGQLPKIDFTGIEEIDQLADAITQLNRDAVESSAKISKILQMSGLSIGVFEIRADSATAYCSDDVFKLLGQTERAGKGNLISKTDCRVMIERAMTDQVEESVYRICGKNADRFVRIRLLEDQQGLIGTIMDVTTDMEYRHQIEHDRDYDQLTGILNRRAFENSANGILQEIASQAGIAAILMMDLDNLKYLNDSYGHDYGDRYIRTFAGKLAEKGRENILVARRSGDEFLALLYHAESQEMILRRIENIWEEIQSATIRLPDGSAYPVQASAGVAWYPSDAKNLDQLTQYADFAMYQCKRNARGTVAEFQREEYAAYQRTLENKAAMERVLDRGLLRFEPCPVFSAQTGAVAGYHLQVKSDEPKLPELEMILELARTNGLAGELDRLFWNTALDTLRILARRHSLGKETKFFLEPMSGCLPQPREMQALGRKYPTILSRTVILLAENPQEDRRWLDSLGCMYAVPGGYDETWESDAAFIVLREEQFCGVEEDEEKQEMIRHIVKGAQQRGQQVLALNVCNEAAMCTLVLCGVTYLQGRLFNGNHCICENGG